MKMIRVILFISCRVNKAKDKYPNLYNTFQEARKKEDYRLNKWISVTDDIYQEYLSFVNTDLVVNKFPNSSRYVWITTHTGGEFIGFYENGKWQYKTYDGKVVEIESKVIKWRSVK